MRIETNPIRIPQFVIESAAADEMNNFDAVVFPQNGIFPFGAPNDRLI